MTYNTLQDLPPALQRTLPKRGQEIYRSVFNSAWEIYNDSNGRRGGSAEETSHKVAWAAVKRSYFKTGEHKWKRK